MSREIRIGKVAGMSSYELAVQAGTFSGTLSEYLNKEQKYYDDMVTYGEQLRSEINSIVRPTQSNVTTTVDTTKLTVPNDAEFELYRYAFTFDAYASISAFIIMNATAEIANANIKLYHNGTLVGATGISNNILSIHGELSVSENDEIWITVYQSSGLSRTISDSSIQINITERS